MMAEVSCRVARRFKAGAVALPPAAADGLEPPLAADADAAMVSTVRLGVRPWLVVAA